MLDHSGEKSNKCNQCDFASYRARSLRAHLWTHSGKMLNKCSQCYYASIDSSSFRKHVKIHNDEKLKKCNQSDFASCNGNALRAQLKTRTWKKLNQCTMGPLQNGVKSGQLWQNISPWILVIEFQNFAHSSLNFPITQINMNIENKDLNNEK